MSDWREVSGYDIGPIRFMPEGTFDFGAGPMPLGMTLKNCSVDEFTINSPAEEDGVITVAGNNGALLQARWTGHGWIVNENEQHVTAYGTASRGAQPHVAAATQGPSLVPFPLPPELMQEPVPRKPFPWRATVVLSLIALAVLAFAYREPIAAYYQRQKAAAGTKRKQEQAAAEYRALKNALAEPLEAAKNGFNAYTVARHQLVRSFDELRLGITIDDLTSDEGKTSVEVDVAFLQDKRFAAAWSALLNAYTDSGLADSATKTLDDLARRAEGEALKKTDESKIKKLAADFENGRLRLNRQQPNLEIIRRKLTGR